VNSNQYEARFWLVQNPKGLNPKFRHATYQAAQAEARRLAALNPGQTFIVLQSCETVTTKPVEVVSKAHAAPDVLAYVKRLEQTNPAALKAAERVTVTDARDPFRGLPTSWGF
jgi:hypothetical protein